MIQASVLRNPFKSLMLFVEEVLLTVSNKADFFPGDMGFVPLKACLLLLLAILDGNWPWKASLCPAPNAKTLPCCNQYFS